MEQEAFFLYVAYYIREAGFTKEDKKDVQIFDVVVKRASIRRPEPGTAQRDGFLFERVPIDFDPSNKQMGYLVTIHTKTEGPGIIVKDKQPQFITITDTEEEAKTVMEELEKGGYRSHLEKKQKLDGIDVQPVLIAEI